LAVVNDGVSITADDQNVSIGAEGHDIAEKRRKSDFRWSGKISLLSPSAQDFCENESGGANGQGRAVGRKSDIPAKDSAGTDGGTDEPGDE
jgi:hypothetical protein